MLGGGGAGKEKGRADSRAVSSNIPLAFTAVEVFFFNASV